MSHQEPKAEVKARADIAWGMTTDTKYPCPSCQQPTAVHKCGLNNAGSQRWRCHRCQRHFTPLRKPMGQAPALREAALGLYLEGARLRAIVRLLHVNHQSVANWVTAAARLPHLVGAPTAGRTVEVDDFYTFVGKKARHYVLIAVDRASGLIVGRGALAQLEWQPMQAFVARLPAGRRYASDLTLGGTTTDGGG